MFNTGINAFAATLVFDSVLARWAHPLRSTVELRYRILDANHGDLAAIRVALAALSAALAAILAATLAALALALAASVADISAAVSIPAAISEASIGAIAKTDSMTAVIRACTMPLYI